MKPETWWTNFFRQKKTTLRATNRGEYAIVIFVLKLKVSEPAASRKNIELKES